MSQPIVIRNKKDRLRYTLIFECLLIAILAPSLSLFLDRPVLDTGGLAIVLSLKAMLINLIFNYLYDRVDVHYGRIPTERGPVSRAIHAISFESCLVATSLPIIMWWLQMTFLEALLMDLSLMGFVVCFTFIYTWGYDRIFPVLQPESEQPELNT